MKREVAHVKVMKYTRTIQIINLKYLENEGVNSEMKEHNLQAKGAPC